MDRDSIAVDLDFDNQVDAALEQRLSGNPRRSSDLDSSKNITVRPPNSDGQLQVQSALNVAESQAAFDSEPPPQSEQGARGVGLSWDFLRRQLPLPLGIRLRALVEVLGVLGSLHTDLLRAPNRRCHGAIYYGNLLFRNDGSALLLQDESVTPQPAVYAAPEVRRHQIVDQQTDCYAIGVMLLEALADQSLSSPEVSDLSQGDLERHPFWGRFAGDPLLWVAVRATARDPSRRWPSAREFADALSECALDRIEPREALGQLICAAFAEQCDRATPLVAVPASSRNVTAVGRAEARTALAPVPTIAAQGSSALPASLLALGLPSSPLAARAAADLRAPQPLEADERGFGVAVSVAAEQIPSFATQPTSLPRSKRKRGPLLAALTALSLTGVAFIALRYSGIAPMALSAERENAVANAAALTPMATAPVVPATPNAAMAPSAAVLSPITPVAAVPSASLAAVSVTGKHLGQEPRPSLPVAAAATPLTHRKNGAARPTPKRTESRATNRGESRPEDGASKPRSAGRYEPDGI